MPWNQPMQNCNTNIIANDEMPKAVPINNVAPAESSKPNGRNLRASLRSDTLPIRNLEKA